MDAWRILVIDDSTTLRKVVEIAMRGTGCEVELAATGHDGVTLARRRPPDAILLDYLLPDLRSTEVCERLAGDAATARVPVIIMSANQRSVLDEFRRFTSVVGFVGKPFTAAEIRGRLEAAVRGALGTRSPIVERTRHVERSERTDDAALADGELRLRGDLTATPLLEVLRLLVATQATGVLTITERVDEHSSSQLSSLGDATARIWLRRGELVMASSTRDSAAAYASISELRSESRSEPRSELREPSPELRDRAASNLADGKPVLVTLAEAGAVRSANLPLELHAASTRWIGELLAARAGRFAWEAGALPAFVEAFGRHVSITALALDLARRAQAGGRSDGALERVFDRTPRFSHKLAGAQLDSGEQRVLGLVDGRASGREIAARAGLAPEIAAAVLARLCAADLIQHGEVSQIAGGRVVAVLDPDRDELIAPLRARLARRAPPIEVIELDASRSLAASALASRADIILIGAVALTRHVLEHELPAIARAGGTAVICVLDAPNPGLASQMLQAGLHAVIAKPVHITDLERLLSVT